MSGETLVRIGGLYCLAFALFHLGFWKLFDWKRDLASLSFLNRGVMQVLNLCLTFVFLIFAAASLLFAPEMVSTGLGRALLTLISLFWLLRAAEQALFFGLGSRISIAFLLVFLAGAALYALPLWLG